MKSVGRQNRATIRSCWCFAGGTVLLAALLFCGFARAESREDRIVAGWKKRLAEIEQALRDQDHKTAADDSSLLGQDIMEMVGRGGSSAEMLALISVYRAIAATGLGKTAEGVWHWRTAQILSSKIVDLDFEQFGPAAGKLKATPFRGEFPPEKLYRTLPATGVKPKLKRRPRAIYPQGMVDLDIEAKYVVEFVVDTDGSVKEPLLISRVREPSLVYALLDGLRKVTFKPASIDGTPVALVVPFEMTFDIRH